MFFISAFRIKVYRIPLGIRTQSLRQFHGTRTAALNPLMPIDPTEILADLDEEENEKKLEKIEEAEKTKGRIKNILRKQKNPITDPEKKDDTDKKETNSTSTSPGGTISNSDNGGGNNNSNNPKKDKDTKEDDKAKSGKTEKKPKPPNENIKTLMTLLKKCTEAGLITLASLGVLVLGGILYHKTYKQNVLWKMDESFEKNESLVLLKHQDHISESDKELWAERGHQDMIDSIVKGDIKGKYYLLLGEKGTGKTSTVMESITRVKGNDCVIVDCSSDIELMRLRIGSALNFEFFEDYVGSMFSMKGPRESVPILDIERAFMKLEQVLIKRRNKTRKPLIMVFNNSHLIDTSLVELLQQKAETFSSSGMLTMIFLSDDYWLFEKLKTFATRLQVLNFEDTKLVDARKILRCARLKYFQDSLSDRECETVYNLIGGRPQHLNHVASQPNMIHAAQELIDNEKLWFLNNCALLGADMDDDVMESGKFATSAMLLMRELVEMDRRRKECDHSDDIIDVTSLPQLPLWRARQVMTRPDYIERYDKLNLFTIGTDANVRADSVPMMRAFHEIAADPGFDSLLSETIDRVSEIESLGRTRELVMKDLAFGAKYRIQDDPESHSKLVTLEEVLEEDADKKKSMDKEELESHFIEHHHEGERKKWWKRRLETYSHSPGEETSSKKK